MPELPEVEFARAELRRWLRGETLVKVTAKAGTPLRATGPADLARLGGHAVRDVERVGKHLLVELEGPRSLYLHLGMTGKVVRRPVGATKVSEPPRFSKVCFGLAKAEVHFCDSRRFGSVRVVPTAELHRLPVVLGLGPDALLALPSAKALHERLARAKRPIKVALLDQSLLAGLGNIQAAEALWRARISPFVRASALSLAQVRALRTAIRATLAFTVRRLSRQAGKDGDVAYVEEGAPNPFAVYDREGLPCQRRDRTPIARVTQAARSTFYCPHCQRG